MYVCGAGHKMTYVLLARFAFQQEEFATIGLPDSGERGNTLAEFGSSPLV
jgi:hypothetical protein